jgi:hypothetical protein
VDENVKTYYRAKDTQLGSLMIFKFYLNQSMPSMPMDSLIFLLKNFRTTKSSLIDSVFLPDDAPTYRFSLCCLGNAIAAR